MHFIKLLSLIGWCRLLCLYFLLVIFCSLLVCLVWTSVARMFCSIVCAYSIVELFFYPSSCSLLQNFYCCYGYGYCYYCYYYWTKQQKQKLGIPGIDWCSHEVLPKSQIVPLTVPELPYLSRNFFVPHFHWHAGQRFRCSVDLSFAIDSFAQVFALFNCKSLKFSIRVVLCVSSSCKRCNKYSKQKRLRYWSPWRPHT